MARDEDPVLVTGPHVASEPAKLAIPAERCPDCAGKSCSKCGSKVPGLTLTSLLTVEAKARLSRPEGFRFCGSPICDTVYWNPETGERFAKKDLRVRVGLKETTPPQPVCYCFGFTAQDLEAQVRDVGTSTIPDEITEKVRQKLCHCEDANPQGTCCLGNVRAAFKAALEAHGVKHHPVSALPTPSSTAEPAHACCAESGDGPAVCAVPAKRPVPTAPVDAPPRSDGHDCCAREAAPAHPTSSPKEAASRAPVLSSIGAVISAILASACCWLPLLLIASGASAASVSSFFEQYRLVFLGGAGLLLGLGFYYVYFRKEECGPGGTCAVPRPRLQRFNKVVLWVATALVVVAGAFPRYVGAFLGGGASPSATSDQLGDRVTYAVEGMSCEACTVHIRSELEKLPGVAHVEVSFERKEATVVAKTGSPLPSDAAVVEAVKRAGYEAKKAPRER